jgi:hypothetical protein
MVCACAGRVRRKNNVAPNAIEVMSILNWASPLRKLAQD